MIGCILSKWLGSFVAIAATTYPMDISWGWVGILPIWFEWVACWATGVEPGRESRIWVRWADALSDAFSFVGVPVAFFLIREQPSPGLTTIALFFSLCGLIRLVRFARKGISTTGHFEGLPVTYTGYLWLPVMWLRSFPMVCGTIILLPAFAMVMTRIKVRPSR